MMKFSNPEIRNIIDQRLKEVKAVQDFEANLSDFIRKMDSIQPEFNTYAMSLEEYNELVIEDYGKANKILQKETSQSIKFIWIVNSYKINELIRVVISLFEESKYYSAISLIRTITEVSCFTHYCIQKIKPHVVSLNNNVNNWNNWQLIHQDIEKITQIASKGTKLDIMINEGTDTKKTISILTSIDKVAKHKDYRTIRKKYDILCEFVHPNIFSNNIFAVVTEIYSNEEKHFKMFTEEKIGFLPGETDRYFKNIPNKFPSMVGLYFGFLISVLDMSNKIFLESIDEAESLKIELPTGKPPWFDKIKSLPQEARKEILYRMRTDRDNGLL